MGLRVRALGGVVLLALMLFSVSIATHAGAQTVYEVRVGRLFKSGDFSRESMRFYPGSIKVHQGDVLHFTSDALHSVALLPQGRVAKTWSGDFAGAIGNPWSLFQLDPDDGSRGMKINMTAAVPSEECGWTAEPVCSFRGEGGDLDGVVNSGLPFDFVTGSAGRLDFSVSIDADPGQTFWVVDLVYPAMAMKIEVVAADAAPSDPVAIAQQGETQFRKDQKTAKTLHAEYVDRRVKKEGGGSSTWTAWAGVDSGTVSLRRMYPAKLSIKKGDSVQWLFSLNRFTAHSVTFPAALASSIGSRFTEVVCDPDGDVVEDNQPDTAATSVTFPYCDEGSVPEFDVASDAFATIGDGVVKGGSDKASSGIRGAAFGTTAKSYKLRFTKASSKAGFSYADVVASMAGAAMRGKVVVSR